MDLNGDGHGDILSGSYADDKMRGLFQVLWGKVEGGFAKAQVLKGSDGKPLLMHQMAPNEIDFESLSEKEENEYFEKSDELILTRPTAVDLNGDGKLDLVAGNSTGTFYLFGGEGEGKFKPQAAKMLDDKGRALRVESKSDPFLFDWDEDGDLDLLSGSDDGAVMMAVNAGSASKAVFQAFKPLLNGPASYSRKGGRPSLSAAENLVRPGGSARVWVEDVNGDGCFDLLVGDYVHFEVLAEGVSEEAYPALQAAWEKKSDALEKEIGPKRSKLMSELMAISEEEEGGERAMEIEDELYTMDDLGKPLDEERAKFIKSVVTGYVWVYYQKQAKEADEAKPASEE